ncbi:MAG TPA: hypothetical protein DEF61_05635 [Firmicutes bacterium]|nr:hypothetical protein [Bacillota bacterium]HBX25703.1 hypothetical protein [Bacillota bacterium]
MGEKLSKKQLQELSSLEEELSFLVDKKKGLEDTLSSLEKENEEKKNTKSEQLANEYKSSLDKINISLKDLSDKEMSLMKSFSSMLDEFNDDYKDIELFDLMVEKEQDDD